MSPSVSDPITVVDPLVRQCGRCRKEFPGEVDAVMGGPLAGVVGLPGMPGEAVQAGGAGRRVSGAVEPAGSGLIEMLRFEWNALRVDDQVLVHDDATAGLTLDEGVVVLVQPAPGVNDVAFRVSRPGAEPDVVRPKRLAVHLRPLDGTSECWRCAQSEVAVAATG